MGEEEPTNLIISDISFYVDFSQEFDYYYNNICSDEKLDLIDDFIDHYEAKGLRNWKGKISSSAIVPDHYPDARYRREHATKHNLYHAHIGLPTWKQSDSGLYLTSDQVLHFQKVSNFEIKLLTCSNHNPMELPTKEDLD